jgi:recombinational DNA repair ATPase RecF
LHPLKNQVEPTQFSLSSSLKMYLKKISLFNYKNFSEADFEFVGKINCFVGKNGIGKTNVLDAIYHLSYGKSYFNPLAVQNIKHGEEFFVIDGEFEINERNEQIICSLKKGQKIFGTRGIYSLSNYFSCRQRFDCGR